MVMLKHVLRHRVQALVVAVVLGCALNSARAAATPADPEPPTPEESDATMRLGQSIAALRAEVDTLAADVDAAREQAQEEALALARRKAALAGQLDELKLTGTELGRRVNALRERGAEQLSAREQAAAPVRAAAARLRAHVVQGIPVRLRERLVRLDDIDLALEVEGPARALELMRGAVEAERALETSHERLRQPVHVDGKPVLAEVLRLGLVQAFYRLKDGAVGEAVASRDVGAKNVSSTSGPAATGWRPITDADARARLLTLFDAMRSGGPSDVVLVPLALPVAAGTSHNEGGAR